MDDSSTLNAAVSRAQKVLLALGMAEGLLRQHMREVSDYLGQMDKNTEILENIGQQLEAFQAHLESDRQQIEAYQAGLATVASALESTKPEIMRRRGLMDQEYAGHEQLLRLVDKAREDLLSLLPHPPDEL